jgi:hypothetical protein
MTIIEVEPQRILNFLEQTCSGPLLASQHMASREVVLRTAAEYIVLCNSRLRSIPGRKVRTLCSSTPLLKDSGPAASRTSLDNTVS